MNWLKALGIAACVTAPWITLDYFVAYRFGLPNSHYIDTFFGCAAGARIVYTLKS